MNRYYILIIVLIIFSCASKKDEVYIENISKDLINNKHKYDLDNQVYTLDKVILYNCTIQKDKEVLDLDLKFIKMTILGTTKPFSNFDSSYSQTVIKFEYLDKDNKVLISEKTGLVENQKNIWMHPPRSGNLDILQLSAFPYIKFNNIKKWTWNLDAAYANYKDAHLAHKYKKGKSIDYKSTIGVLSCIPIYATTKSYVGTTTSEFLFNEEYGFIKLEFKTIEGTTITLEMIM